MQDHAETMIFDSIAGCDCGILEALKTAGKTTTTQPTNAIPPGILIRRLLALAWQFRADCLWSLVLSLVLLLLGIAGTAIAGRGH